MTDKEVVALVEPLIRHRAFASAEDAVRELVANFILRQLDHYREKVVALETRYGMSFDQFQTYLKERSALLVNGHLDPELKTKVAQAVMSEEEDWLDWKINREFLQSWLGMKSEAAS